MPIAVAVRDLEKDASSLASVRVKCDRCDPDSPHPIPREKCSKCQGIGYVLPIACEVANDLRRARLALLKGDLDSEFDE